MWAGGGVLGRNFEDGEFIFKISPRGFSVAEFTDDGNQLASLNKVDAWIPDLNKSDPSHLLKSVKTSSEYTFAQRITLSADEFQKLIEKLPKAKRMLNSVSSETNDVKDSQPQPKKRRVDIVSVPEN